MFGASLEGQVIDSYRILEPLGRGGMAQVYRAYHARLDRYVAVKVLRAELAEEDEFLTRFRHEAQAVARLRHANIVQVYDFNFQEGVYYMVMELLEGDTLKMRINNYRVRNEQMPWGEMARILLDVLDGLEYAHGEGMVHRDIKPANVLLTKRGQAVLADFGIAQIVGSTRHTVSGALLGTLNYMAPEQGLKGKCDVRSDLYSLGIVFYEMLTRRTPFDADTPLAILMKHHNDPLPIPRQIEPAIPASFERVVLKALAKEPDHRYQSAAEMAQALYQAVDEAGLELPETISRPLSFTTAETPGESVAIFSGSARRQLAEADFAADDTDANALKAFKAEAVAEMETTAAAAEPPAGPRMVLSEPIREVRQNGRSPGIAAANAAFVMIVTNLVLILLAGPDFGRFFVSVWPIELLLIAYILARLMASTRSIWFLIPAGLVGGNGLLLAYYTLTDNWNDWTFLWPIEPLLIIGVIMLTLNLAPRAARGDSRIPGFAGWLLSLFLLLSTAGVCFLAFAARY